jgi:3-oxoacyl-[acyl-carrier protein] reductase
VLIPKSSGYKGMPLENIEAGLAKMCPLNRVAVPSDIGRVVAFLASEEGEWINGMYPFSVTRE